MAKAPLRNELMRAAAVQPLIAALHLPYRLDAYWRHADIMRLGPTRRRLVECRPLVGMIQYLVNRHGVVLGLTRSESNQSARAARGKNHFVPPHMVPPE
jgi:hypothetical protein